MKIGDRDFIASAPMAIAWRNAAEDLGVRFESPFAMEYEGRNYWVSGWLPDFGCENGAVIADRFADDQVLDVADALGFYASGLSPHFYEKYDRELFMETLNDWGWFSDVDEAPSWFVGGFRRHGGPED